MNELMDIANWNIYTLLTIGLRTEGDDADDIIPVYMQYEYITV